MPKLKDQLAIPEAVTADLVVNRALLRRGRPYEEAVQLFSPFTATRDLTPRPELRAAT
jgi:hypothetical protein